MDVKATAKTVRHTPRKVRLVLDTIRGKDVNEALAILKFTPNHAAADVAKVVKSAAANAVHNNGLQEEALYLIHPQSLMPLVSRSWATTNSVQTTLPTWHPVTTQFSVTTTENGIL